MSNESWKRGHRDVRKFSIPRIEDDENERDRLMIDEFLRSPSPRNGTGSRVFTALFGVVALVSFYSAATFFALRALGVDVEYVDAVIVAGSLTFIRHLDAAVMRNIG